jgi:PKD repeat protein
MSVWFTDKSQGAPTSWQWDFGDGTTATEQNPTHQYNSLGTYTVKLTASNTNGQDVATKNGYIVTTLAPVANFQVDERIGKAPFIVQFRDISTGNPTAWSWDFGDGTTSSEQNPRHVYPSEGAYNVRLTASNAYGSDTSFKTGTAPVVTTTAPVQTTVPVTQSTVVITTPPTPVPTTKSPLSPVVTVIATISGILALVVVTRK